MNDDERAALQALAAAVVELEERVQHLETALAPPAERGVLETGHRIFVERLRARRTE